jgi:hypothetical protein
MFGSVLLMAGVVRFGLVWHFAFTTWCQRDDDSVPAGHAGAMTMSFVSDMDKKTLPNYRFIAPTDQVCPTGRRPFGSLFVTVST